MNHCDWLMHILIKKIKFKTLLTDLEDCTSLAEICTVWCSVFLISINTLTLKSNVKLSRGLWESWHSWSPQDEPRWLWWFPDFSSRTRGVMFLSFSETSHQLLMDCHEIWYHTRRYFSSSHILVYVFPQSITSVAVDSESCAMVVQNQRLILLYCTKYMYFSWHLDYCTMTKFITRHTVVLSSWSVPGN